MFYPISVSNRKQASFEYRHYLNTASILGIKVSVHHYCEWINTKKQDKTKILYTSEYSSKAVCSQHVTEVFGTKLIPTALNLLLPLSTECLS